jgi:hypothetical protein
MIVSSELPPNDIMDSLHTIMYAADRITCQELVVIRR